MKSIKEMLRVIDTKEEEKKQAQKKLGYITDFADLEPKELFKSHKVMISIIKYTHRFNHYRLWYMIINNNLIEANYSRNNETET